MTTTAAIACVDPRENAGARAIARGGRARAPAAWLRRWPHLLLAIAAAGGLTGCGGPATARPTDAMTDAPPASAAPARLEHTNPFFVPGETMSFELSYEGILTGRAVLAVGRPGMVQERPVLIVRSLFETAGAVKIFKKLRDDIHTHLDWRTGMPIEHRAELTASDKHIRVSTRFAGGQALIEYERNDRPKRIIRVVLPEGETVHDMHSILGALRAWDPAPGALVHIYSVSGRRVWRSELRFTGSETVRTAMGLRAALRFEGVATRLKNPTLEVDENKPPREIVLLLSDDAHRMPLRVVAHTEYGDLQAELVAYEHPGEQLTRR